MASKLIVTVDGVTPEQVGALYKQLVMSVAGLPQPEIEILVNNLAVAPDPVQMPDTVGLDGKPVVSRPTTSGLAAR